jgi:adenylate kinase family enzyme
MQRVLVLGSSGSGKSTFARQLGTTLSLPVVHIDQLFWQAGWVPTPKSVFLERLQRAVAEERWIMDGNSPSTLDLRLPRADRVILLDRSRLVCLVRIGRRIASSYGVVRPDMAPGCPEKIDWEFLKFVWNFPNTHWPQTLAAIERHQAWERTTSLKSDAETAAFLSDLRPDAIEPNQQKVRS